MSNQKQKMGGSSKEAYDEISKVLFNRSEDITNAYLKSGKDVEWYIHFIRCLDSIKKGPPAKDAAAEQDSEESGSGNGRMIRNLKRQRVVYSSSPTPSGPDADADGDNLKPAGTVGKVLTTSGAATFRVLEGPATIHVKTEGSVTVKVTQAATVRVEEARKVQVETERGNCVTTFEADGSCEAGGGI